MITKIISGHQTGVDLGAIDAALSMGLPTSGYVPRGRKNEDGVIPAHYRVIELDTEEYPPRTKRNIESAGTTVILYRKTRGPGTMLTIKLADQRVSKSENDPTDDYQMDLYDLSVEKSDDYQSMVAELSESLSGVVNFAGSRESGAPGIQREVYEIVRRVIQAQKALAKSGK